MFAPRLWNWSVILNKKRLVSCMDCFQAHMNFKNSSWDWSSIRTLAPNSSAGIKEEISSSPVLFKDRRSPVGSRHYFISLQISINFQTNFCPLFSICVRRTCAWHSTRNQSSRLLSTPLQCSHRWLPTPGRSRCTCSSGRSPTTRNVQIMYGKLRVVDYIWRLTAS